VGEVKDDIIEGKSLSKALSQHPKAFDNLYVSMIEAAEASGSYVDVLNDLAKSLDKAENIRRKVKSALQMPLITIAIAIIVTLGLIRFAVPQFTALFENLGGELPLPTKTLIAISNWLQGVSGVVTIFMVIVFAVLMRKVTRTKKGKNVWDRVKLKLPLFGMLLLKRSIVSFSSTLALLLRNGVDYLAALDIVRNAADNEQVRQILTQAQQSINRGDTLSQPLMDSNLFPPLVCQMIQSGEKSGKVDEMLGKLAEIYEREVDQSVENLSKALEPLLTVILGIMIGGVLIGLYLPVFKTGELITGG
jgi:type IV pilus assembly protein PilC